MRVKPYARAVIVLLVSAYGTATLAATPVALAWVTSEKSGTPLTLQGSVVSTKDAMLSTEIAGQLVWLAELGTCAKQGDALATIDDSRQQIELLAARATINGLAATRDFLVEESGRITLLTQSNALAASTLAEIRMRLEVAKSDLAKANAARARIEHDIRAATVRAPYSGCISDRPAAVGQHMAAGEVILRLVDTEQTEVQIRAPLAALSDLSLQRDLSVAYGETRFTLPVKTIVRVGETVSRSFELRLDARDTGLVVGSPVTVILDRDSETLTAIPRDALVLRRDSQYVVRVDSDLTAERIPIEVLGENGDRLFVAGELMPGDQVVVRGAERLEDGEIVNPSL